MTRDDAARLFPAAEDHLRAAGLTWTLATDATLASRARLRPDDAVALRSGSMFPRLTLTALCGPACGPTFKEDARCSPV